MRKIASFASLYLGLILILFSCASLPKQASIYPQYYEDEDVKVTYAIGTAVHYIEIKNKTNKAILIIENRCSIITVNGQSRSLNLEGMDEHIPPNSSVVFKAKQKAFFYSDINKDFKKAPKGLKAKGDGIVYIAYDDKTIIEEWANKVIRLYIPYIIDGKEKVVDISLVIMDSKGE